ncbi:MAG TPA: SUMF1/EgtB/PvdO family nonheme iron enzyme, partial [Candidatus Manganitrophaceae bacterium]|nr:SUMF1/EgtB/PvdO family nonheme iron enzyme [Candidatus Manganitrophaceae bacterium]
GVEGGEFLMGTDEVDETGFAAEQGIVKPWFVDEGPSHQVYLPPFYIDRYEVTNHRYAQFVRATGRSAPPHWENGAPPPGSDFFPVAMIRWQEAQDYCRWRGGRLPTEAEWEKAARGTDGRRYPWGNDFDLQKANVGGVAKDLAPAGAFPESVSPYGALDMIGNVWEWTADWYQPYPGARYQSKEYGKRLKVIRGNSWSAIGHYPPEVQKELVKFHSTTTFRLYASPDEAINDVGFRCVQPGS